MGSINDYEYYSSTQARLDAYNLFSSMGCNAKKLFNSTPKYLYKFATINKFVLENLKNQKTTASKPDVFNDSDDSVLTTHFQSEPLQISEIALNAEQQREINDHQKIADARMARAFRPIARQLVFATCFSETYNNHSMWSYYSDGGRGICIEYEVNPCQWQSLLFPVIYADNLLDLTELGNPNEFNADTIRKVLLATTLCKKSEWSHENEWRLFLPFGNGESDEDSRIRVKAPKIHRILIGPRFVEYWMDKKRISNRKEAERELREYYYPFCNSLIERQIPIFLAKSKPDEDEYTAVKRVSVELLKDLSEFGLSDFLD